MATTKTKDLRGMSDEQLGLTLKDTEKHLFQLRFQSAPDQLATRITGLEKKVSEAAPGKRVAFRQAKRLKRFHAAKTATPAAAGTGTVAGATGKAGTKGSGK